MNIILDETTNKIIDENKSKFISNVVDTRNYYTHYDESKMEKALSGNDLTDGMFILQLILELYVCRFLGIDVKDKVGRQLSNFRMARQ